MNPSNENSFKVLIVGGGVAALEATLALHDLAGDRVAITLLAPEPEFVYRPMRVREPFAYSAAQHYSLPVKHGGIASQQADAAAEAIAPLAGVPLEPKAFRPVIRAILLGADRPLYLSAQLTGGQGSNSEVSDSPTWYPPAKIAAKYLAPYLEARGQITTGAGA